MPDQWVVAVEDMWEAVRECVDAGVPEIHVGATHCGFCGADLGDTVDTELLHYPDKPRTVIRLNLCERCYRNYKKAWRARLQ